MKRHRRRLAGALALALTVSLGWAPWAHAAGAGKAKSAEPVPAAVAPATPPPASSADPAELKALKEQLDALNQKILVLERKSEIEKEEKATKAKDTPVLTYKDGFTFSSGDGQYQLKIGGWVQTDLAAIDSSKSLQQAFGKEQDGFGFRSARIRLNGKLTDFVEWQAEYEFAGENGTDTPSFYDTYVQFDGIPYLPGAAGDLRIGHFREPFSLEELTSLRSLTFQERSLNAVFNPVRNIGIQWSDAVFGAEKQERLSYQVGLFKVADNWPSSNDSDDDQGWAVTGRVTGLPYYKGNGEQLLHLGLAYSHRNPDGAVLGWNARPESRLAQFRYANADGTAPTPPLAPFRLRDARADNVDQFNLEAAFNYRSLLLQGEYTYAKVDTTFGGERNFSGYYLQASYLLTGETHPYKNANGVFDRVRPKKNFGFKPGDGWGAWEVGARYSGVDLTDGPVRGGKQSGYTVGVNWYINPFVGASLNYSHDKVENDLFEGDLNELQARVRFEF